MLGDRYELRERIGEGDLAVVYAGWDTRLHRLVAIKVLRAQHAADPQCLDRFRRGARAAGSLTHPNVVAVYDSGQDGDTHYVVLELLPGPTLETYLQERGALPAAVAVAIARQILAGLQAAHARGLVHRDVRPRNVLFAEDGSIKVADFATARAVDDTSLPAVGEVIGAAHYLSPEQARSEPVGPASDIYSVGVVLYEMVAGRPPFAGDTDRSIALKHVAEPPPPLARVAPTVPPGLARLTMRALAKDPLRRWPDAAAMDQALAECQAAAGEATATFAVASTAASAPIGGWPPPPAAGGPVARPPGQAVRHPPGGGGPPPGLLATGALVVFLIGFLLAFGAGTGLLIANRPAATNLLGRLAGAVGLAGGGGGRAAEPAPAPAASPPTPAPAVAEPTAAATPASPTRATAQPTPTKRATAAPTPRPP